MKIKNWRQIVSATLVFLVFSSCASQAKAEEFQPFQKTLRISAYYSPLPDQSVYFRGSYDADRRLNGNGTHGADGTPVYVGMLAAPKSYAFGTKLAIRNSEFSRSSYFVLRTFFTSQNSFLVHGTTRALS